MTLSQQDPLLAQTGLDGNERTLRARQASNIMWGQCEDRTLRTAPARDAFLEKLADQIDRDRILPEKERTKRVENLRKAHMQRMALASAKARRLRAEAKARGAGEE